MNSAKDLALQPKMGQHETDKTKPHRELLVPARIRLPIELSVTITFPQVVVQSENVAS